MYDLISYFKSLVCLYFAHFFIFFHRLDTLIDMYDFSYDFRRPLGISLNSVHRHYRFLLASGCVGRKLF